MARGPVAPHRHVRRGKRVRIVLRDGTEIIGKFIESTDRFVILDENRRIATDTIRSFGIYRDKS